VAATQIKLDRADASLYLTAMPREAGRYQRWRCASNSVGWVRPTADELFSAAIDRKAAKLSTYRRTADRIALLIVADATGTAGMLRTSVELQVPKQGLTRSTFTGILRRRFNWPERVRPKGAPRLPRIGDKRNSTNPCCRARRPRSDGDSLGSTPTSRSTKSNRRDTSPRLRSPWHANAGR
jgi:hypothetical protein